MVLKLSSHVGFLEERVSEWEMCSTIIGEKAKTEDEGKQQAMIVIQAKRVK